MLSLLSSSLQDDLSKLLEDSPVSSRLDIQKLEYDESVSDWIAVFRSWLEEIGGGQTELFEVIEGTVMSPVMVWMALLLGEFELRKEGDFYQGDVLVG